MVDFTKVWNWYSRETVQRALLEAGKNREVVSVFRDGSFGKRPDMIQYQADVLQAVANGTVAFHGSVERWHQPMNLDVGMNKTNLDNLRQGFDILIDPDVADFEISKITAKQIIEALKDHGVVNYSVKFSGGKGFHLGIPFESLPEKINFQNTQTFYPEILQKVIGYVKFYTKDMLKESILSIATPAEISQRIGKPLEEIVNSEGLDPFKVVNMDVFSSRHLFRLPYSLHEKNILVSVPLKPAAIEKFEKEQALPEKVKIEEKFLQQRMPSKDAEMFVVEALDWAAKNKVEVLEEIPKGRKFFQPKFVPENYFPPCIKHMLNNGLADGKKRAVFILVNFLRNMGWDLDKIEKKLMEWNEKNQPPLRTAYLRGQMRWHFRQDRNLLPPNCDNENFYKAMGLYDICCKEVDHTTIKNPVNVPLRRLKNVDKLKIQRKRFD